MKMYTSYALATLRQNFVFRHFLSKILPGKKSEVNKILNEKSDISLVILAKVAKFCPKYFDHISKRTQIQNLFGCEKNPDTIFISQNIDFQKFSRFGANFVRL